MISFSTKKNRWIYDRMPTFLIIYPKKINSISLKLEFE